MGGHTFLVFGVARWSCDCSSDMARGVLDRDQGLSAIETPFVLCARTRPRARLTMDASSPSQGMACLSAAAGV